jgi:hypothetical protein
VRPGESPPGPEVVGPCLEALARRYDPEWGGFSGAPKFPTPSNLFFLLELAADEPRARTMLDATLDQMARGGIHDHLAGGFHRYATDRAWRIPHFEKMLYDNALLLEVYARAHAGGGGAGAARVARSTAAFLEREMGLPEGGFASAIDAETGGREGAYYVWTADELGQVLGEEGFAFAAPFYGVAGPPFFEDEAYVLHRPEPLEAEAERRRITPEALLADFEPARRALLAARDQRPRPLTDDKVLADWNGMAVGALAVAGRLLGEQGLVARAARAADFVLAGLRPAGGPLHHSWRQGEARVPAMLADYAWMVRGLLALERATGDGRWLAAARDLAGEQGDRLADPAGGFFVSAARPDLLFRTHDLFDGAVPSAGAVAVLDLLALARRTGDDRWRREAERALAAAAPLVEQFPDGARTFVLAARRWHGAGGAGVPVGAAAGRPPTALEREAEAVVELALEAGEPDGDGWRPFRLAVALAPGWHVDPPGGAAGPGAPDRVPSRLAAEGARLRDVVWPEPVEEAVAGGGEPLRVHRGRFVVVGALRPDPGARAALVLTVQPCDDRRCLPPVARRAEVG